LTKQQLKIKNMKSQNISKVRAHDAIVGLLYLSGVGLAYLTSDINFLWIVVAVGALQVISPVTKFCPVYTILNKLMPESDPIQNGK
jgi:hypothetical protein